VTMAVVAISLGSVDIRFISLLCLKNRQSRREERSLVIPNKRRVTLIGAFSGTTRRAGPIFPLHCVVSRLCRMTTLHFFRLAEQKNGRQQGVNLMSTEPKFGRS